MAARPASRFKELRLVVLGHAATHIVRGFVIGHYSDEYDPTSGSWRFQKVVQETPVMLEIEDISWPDHLSSYGALMKQHLRQAHALIHVIEPTRPLSNKKLENLRFGDLRALFDEEKQVHGCQEAVIILWRDDEMALSSQHGDQWEAGIAQGRDFAERSGAMGPLIAHATSGKGVEEAFMQVAAEVLKSLQSAQHRGERQQDTVTQPGEQSSRSSGLKRVLESISQRFHDN